jgi:hypothetical protein
VAFELLNRPTPTVSRTLVCTDGAKGNTNTSVVRLAVGFLLKEVLRG